MGTTAKDPEAKKRLGYVEPESIVYADGREKLVGRDWRRRVEELLGRCAMRCEQTWFGLSGSVRCLNMADDPHHIVKRSVLRDDRLTNLQALCRYHHNLLDNRKPQWRNHDA